MGDYGQRQSRPGSGQAPTSQVVPAPVPGRQTLVQAQTSSPAAADRTSTPGSAVPAAAAALGGPLTDAERAQIASWLQHGEVGIDAISSDAENNIRIIARALFGQRLLMARSQDAPRDPLVGVVPEVTDADPQCTQLREQVRAFMAPLQEGVRDWGAETLVTREVYVMTKLIDTYHYTSGAAAGVVGNMVAESSVMPNMIEGGSVPAPMSSRPGDGQAPVDYSASEVMHRGEPGVTGPRRPGVGLAQWTYPSLREGLFHHSFRGTELGASILFNMDAQIDYLVQRLAASNRAFPTMATAEAASDYILFNVERPGVVVDNPRDSAPVVAVRDRRRGNAAAALSNWQAQNPATH